MWTFFSSCASRILTTMDVIMVLSLLLTVATTVYGQNPGAQIIQYSQFEEAPQFVFVGNVGTDIIATGIINNLSTEQLAALKFSILGDDDSVGEYFTIDVDSGVLRTNKRIDREAICPQQEKCVILLNVGVLSDGFFAPIDIEVSIDDLNDNAPRFLENEIRKSIPENTAVGTSLSLPTADDLDSPRNSIANYQLLSGSPEFELQVSESLDAVYLVLKQELDREQRESYSLVIAAYDGGREPQSGTLTMDISIQDVNDNVPEFTNQTYDVTVPEDQEVNTVIIQVTAIDPDLGDNGAISYSFTTKTKLNFGTTFSIDNKTGDIYLRQALDYELKQDYNLIVTASEKNPESLPVEARVNVHVRDVNDLPPQITVNALTESKQVQITEAAPIGTFVAHIKVSDPDLGQSGQFSCALRSSLTTVVFEVQELYSGAYTLVTSAVLDRELMPEYDMEFVCTDEGNPPLSSTADIKVTILDENDNSPLFTHNTYSVTINENNYPGRFLAQLSAVDHDEGSNGEVQYMLDDQGQQYLSVDPVTGNLTAKISYDHEQDQELSLRVFAVDKGNPAKSSSVTVNIIINDLNDEAPEFTLEKYTFQIDENDAIGQEVGEVSANDPDSYPNNDFSYSIDEQQTAEAARNSFTIDPNSGMIITLAHLDREKDTDFLLIVKATDASDPSLYTTSTVLIYVTDKNDNYPVITYPSALNNSVSLTPAVFRERVFTQINAQDVDSGSNARLGFFITAGNEGNLFVIDKNTGYISIASDVTTIKKQTYRLVISVQDHGNPPKITDATLKIMVNRTLLANEASELIIGGNLTIVVSVAVISAVLTIILIIAIVLMCHRQGKKSYLSALLRASSPRPDDSMDSVEAAKKRKEVSFSNEVEISDEGMPPPQSHQQYMQQKGTYSTNGSGVSTGYQRQPQKKQPCNNYSSHDPQLQAHGTKATQNNYLMMPVASKDSDSAHSEDSTNTDSGRGSDTTEQTMQIDHNNRGAGRHLQRHLGNVQQREYREDRAVATSSPRHPSRPIIPPRAPRDAPSPYSHPRGQQPPYHRTPSWNSEASHVQLEDEVFKITPSHV